MARYGRPHWAAHTLANALLPLAIFDRKYAGDKRNENRFDVLSQNSKFYGGMFYSSSISIALGWRVVITGEIGSNMTKIITYITTPLALLFFLSACNKPADKANTDAAQQNVEIAPKADEVKADEPKADEVNADAIAGEAKADADTAAVQDLYAQIPDKGIPIPLDESGKPAQYAEFLPPDDAKTQTDYIYKNVPLSFVLNYEKSLKNAGFVNTHEEFGGMPRYINKIGPKRELQVDMDCVSDEFHGDGLDLGPFDGNCRLIMWANDFD